MSEIKLPANISKEEWAELISVQLASMIITTIDKEKTKFGKEFCDKALGNFITEVIRLSVYTTLTDHATSKKLDDEQKVEMINRDIQRLKASLTEAVAQGFSVAFSQFAKKPIDYVCQLYMVEEPKNKNLLC